MEKKKELLIKVLTKLQPYRNLAPGILALVESGYVDEKTIGGIILLMNTSLKKIKKGKGKKQIEQSLEVIKKLRKKEAKEREEENADQLLEDI